VALAPIEENGDLLGVVCTMRDISMLKEVARMKDAFVSNVSHELRTPITSLKLNHKLIEMNPERTSTYVDRLGREIDRLNRLIEDLLRLSRLDQGRVNLDLRLVDLNRLAAQYVNDRTPLAESRELTLSFEALADLPMIQADEGLIGQSLSIILTNALNYTPAGGEVVVSAVSREVEGKNWAGFRVADTGPGISPEEQAHLFERFFRGNAAYESGAPGTGLGLSIAREIVERHGGHIDVANRDNPQGGAVITVWLPIEPPKT
jgi:signal transduction histidine kinase